MESLAFQGRDKRPILYSSVLSPKCMLLLFVVVLVNLCSHPAWSKIPCHFAIVQCHLEPSAGLGLWDNGTDWDSHVALAMISETLLLHLFFILFLSPEKSLGFAHCWWAPCNVPLSAIREIVRKSTGGHEVLSCFCHHLSGVQVQFLCSLIHKFLNSLETCSNHQKSMRLSLFTRMI